jgi:hypothetical protein
LYSDFWGITSTFTVRRFATVSSLSRRIDTTVSSPGSCSTFGNGADDWASKWKPSSDNPYTIKNATRIPTMITTRDLRLGASGAAAGGCSGGFGGVVGGGVGGAEWVVYQDLRGARMLDVGYDDR